MKISRRTVMFLLFPVAIAAIIGFARRVHLIAEIRGFFGLDSAADQFIMERIKLMKAQRPRMWIASTVFFVLQKYRMRFLLPRNFQSTVLKYWSKLLNHPQVAWQYVYLPIGNQPCNGLIRQ